MHMRTFNPQLAELMSELDKVPLKTSLRTFGEIVNAMRTTHAFLMVASDKFQGIYNDAVNSGKYTASGLRDQKEDFENAYKPYCKRFTNMLSEEIDRWKSREQKNAYEVVSKAPSEEQARSLSVILSREDMSQAEMEMWAKNFGDNYICSCAFRDYAKKLGYIVLYSDFTDAEERINIIEDAYERLEDMLSCINASEKGNYKLLVFYGTSDNTGEYFSGTWVDEYTEILDKDATFKADQKIEVRPMTEEEKEEKKDKAS